MQKPLIRRAVRRLAQAFAGFCAFAVLQWVVPPVLHRIRGFCPMRSEPMRAANAVPAFARKYKVSCMQCHSNFPLLNAFGRAFKMNGYSMKGLSDSLAGKGVFKSGDGLLQTVEQFPLSVVLRMRPYTKQSPGDNEFDYQPIDDVDLFAAGGNVAGTGAFYFGEIDMNAQSHFSPGIGDVEGGFRVNQYFLPYVARRGFFVMDPYQILSNFGSPTIANRSIAMLQPDQGGLSQNTNDQTAPNAGFFGLASDPGVGSVYYQAGMTSGNLANESNNASTVEGSGYKSADLYLAFDNLNQGLSFLPFDDLMLGTFGTYGRQGGRSTAANNNAVPVEDAKGGFDALAEMGDWTFRGAFAYQHDNAPVPVSYNGMTDALRSTDRSAYGELMYIYRKGGLPDLVPFVRYNWYTTNDDQYQFDYVTAQLTHYFTSNLKGFVEYSVSTNKNTDPNLAYTAVGANSPSTVVMGNRLSAQLELGF